MADGAPDPLAAAREAIRELATGYLSALPAKLDEIDAAWAQLTNGQWDGERLRELHRTVHSMAGSARVFGVPAVGEAARGVEVHLQPLLEQATRPEEPTLRAVEDALQQLRSAAELPPS